MGGATNTAVIAATIIIVLVVIIAAYVTTTEVEKDIERSGKKGSMTTVPGKSFMDLPHGPLRSTALSRVEAGAGPGFQFNRQQVAGASYAHM